MAFSEPRRDGGVWHRWAGHCLLGYLFRHSQRKGQERTITYNQILLHRLLLGQIWTTQAFKCGDSISKERKLPKVKIKFGHVNARSRYPKLDEIHTVVKKHDFDVFLYMWNMTYSEKIHVVPKEVVSVYMQKTISLSKLGMIWCLMRLKQSGLS